MSINQTVFSLNKDKQQVSSENERVLLFFNHSLDNSGCNARLHVNSSTMKSPKTLAILLTISTAFGAYTPAAEYRIRPGDNPQAVMDSVASGDKLVFLPGLHICTPGKYRSLLYVDKPVYIEIMAGATLKLADGACVHERTGEITTDQDGSKKLDDLEIGGDFDIQSVPPGSRGQYGAKVYTIVIDKEGIDGKPDLFRWGEHKLFETPNRGIPITGDWQPLSHGVKIRFASKTGHATGNLWFVSYDGPEVYGIRIGHGRQNNYIENVTISGKGTIDLNGSKNAQPGDLVKNINACVLIHGRVRNVLIEGITMVDTNRSVMCYGEHSGKLLAGGKTSPGESFDAENITIQRTRTINPGGAAYLLGHPSFRGQLRNVKCNFNYMETAKTAIEPNFNLENYEVIGNVIKSGGQAIHCWRFSKNGVVADNLRIDDNTGKPVVVVNSPRGWQPPEPPVMRNNRNHLSDSPMIENR